MKRAVFSSIIIAFFILSLIGDSGHAQNRRRPRSKSQAAQGRTVGEAAANTSDEDNAKIIEECSLPDRPRPEATIVTPVRCGKAISLPRPPYPEEARAAKASGTVAVDIVIDEKGRVIWAKATSGHQLLQASAVWAACRARYSPLKVSGQAVKANSSISYNFVLQ